MDDDNLFIFMTLFWWLHNEDPIEYKWNGFSMKWDDWNWSSRVSLSSSCPPVVSPVAATVAALSPWLGSAGRNVPCVILPFLRSAMPVTCTLNFVQNSVGIHLGHHCVINSELPITGLLCNNQPRSDSHSGIVYIDDIVISSTIILFDEWFDRSTDHDCILIFINTNWSHHIIHNNMSASSLAAMLPRLGLQHYKGETRDQQPHGQGEYLLVDGTIYSGQFHEGL